MMGLTERTEIKRPALDSGPAKREMARFLLNTYYTSIYGIGIRKETVRSMRLKIHELEDHLQTETQWDVRRSLVRQCQDFERVCMLLEILM